jgi:sec-independent protein translocase protein TatA
MSIGPLEIAIVVAIILLLFGARKLPELGKGLGSGMREFKDGITGKDGGEDRQESLEESTSAPQSEPRAAEKQRQ